MQVSVEQAQELETIMNQALQNDDMEMETIFTPMNHRIDRRTFEKLVSRLKGLNYDETNHSETLDISYDNSDIRVTVTGMKDIADYCNHNDIDKIKDLVFTKKNRLSKLDLIEYNIRINLKNEVLLDKTDSQVVDLLNNFNKKKKDFRIKKRISFVTPDNLFRFDITQVKTPSIVNRKYVQSVSLVNSDVINNQVNYEVELEYIGDNGDLEEIKNLNTYYSGIVLQSFQSSNFIMSNDEKTQVIKDYVKLVKGVNLNSEDIESNNPRYLKEYWVGPQPISLEMEHIREYDEEDIVTIRRNYSVTDKADGERYLMYVNDEGKCYLLNNRFRVIYLGVKASDLSNSVLDGEFINYDKYGKYHPIYLLFDIYFKNGDDIRELPFYMAKQKSRYTELDISIKSQDWENIEEQTLLVDIRTKKFYFGDVDKSGTKIFENCKTILDGIKSSLYEYETDGLIFTPTNLAVGTNFIGDNIPKNTGVTWKSNFKWKPPEDNTIDFLVEVVKDEKTKTEKIDYLFSNVSTKPYKTLHLKCGFDPSRVVKHTIKELLESDFKHNQVKSDYYPVNFNPTEPSIDKSYVAHIELDENMKMKTYKNDEEIFDNMIVEMSYNTSDDTETEWNWKPRNVRYDKTEQLQSGMKQFGNDFTTANNIWKTIHNPVTYEMITTGTNIPDLIEEDIRYYARVRPREKSLTKPMLDFHNLYIKSKLIQSLTVNRTGSVLLDIGCGKGGDIPKWKDLDINFFLGIDNNKDNIENQIDGACTRYLNNQKKFHNTLPKALFIWADAMKPLTSITKNDNSGLDEYNKNILELLWGKTDLTNIIDPKQRDLWGICSNGFDGITSQFVIHYFFKNKFTIENFIKNISTNLKEGGYFVGTCFDGQSLYNDLKEYKKGEFISGEIKGRTLWRIEKNYDYNEPILEDSDDTLGLEVDVLIETINQKLTEYLVNFDYFKRVMLENKMELISDSEANSLGFPKGSTSFSELFTLMKSEPDSHKYVNALKMTDAEQQLSFYNRYFIFKKNSEITVPIKDTTPKTDKNITTAEPKKRKISRKKIIVPKK